MDTDLKLSTEFERIYMEYRPRLLRLARKYVGDTDEAEDMVSASFASYWENRERYTDDNIPALVTRILTNKCLNWLKARQLHYKIEGRLYDDMMRRNRLRIASLESSDPDSLFEEEIISIVRDTLNEMPELTREIFTRLRLENRSYREIEEEKAVNTQKIQYEVKKAVKALRLALNDFLMLF